MIKFFTDFFKGLREVADEDPVMKWVIPLVLLFVMIITFSYMKMIFGVILLAYICLVFSVFLFGDINILEETDEYIEKEYRLWGMAIKVKNKK